MHTLDPKTPYRSQSLLDLAPWPAAMLVTALLTGIVMSGCEGDDDGYGGGGSNSVDAASGDLTAGEELYMDNCASCHGSDAHGASGPGLAGISDSNGVVDIILYGEDSMPGFADVLSDADISDILAWLGSL